MIQMLFQYIYKLYLGGILRFPSKYNLPKLQLSSTVKEFTAYIYTYI